ncbi:MAG TPA: DEAD/DEAH box helicase family protein [Nitrososphaera sp.]|nr:DEAD/DEAH box helicase family protein [Nitrososphaera sp.]
MTAEEESRNNMVVTTQNTKSHPVLGNTLEEVEATRRQLEMMQQEIQEKIEQAKVLESRLRQQNENITCAVSVINEKLGELVDQEQFLRFMGKPYTTWQVPKQNRALVFVPKWVKNFKGVGWLVRESDGYYVYEINQYSVFLGDIPDDLKSAVNFIKEIDGYIEGDTLHFDPSQKDIIKKKLGKHIDVANMGDNQARILRYHTFDLIADMIDAGCLPFRPMPITRSDLKRNITFKDWCKERGLDWRQYQQEYIDTMYQYGAMGVFAPTGAGKSIIALYFIDVLKGRKRIFYPRRTLAEQWQYYLEKYVPGEVNNVILRTLQGLRETDMQEEVTLNVYDEVQHLPADTLSRAALAPSIYRIGLSASPHREDGRESYIFALTGVPKGTNWQEYMKAVNRHYHPVHVHIVKNEYHKMLKVRELLDRSKKTFIFCDSLDLGKRIASDLQVPFVYGETDNRLEVINGNRVVVISRVGDLGISVKDLQRVIEVDFLFGSRQQELQRTGRLMHSQNTGLRHDIIFTEEEYHQYGKRLFALREKGFVIKIVNE